MIPPSARFRTILVPFDGSRLAEQAIPVAQAIAQRARCKLKLALVHQPPPHGITATHQDQVNAELLQFLRSLRHQGSATG